MNETGVIPLIRYRNVTQAVHWLIKFFGFKAFSVVKNPDGTISYAELSHGCGLLMVGPVGQSRLDDILKQPHEINGINTQCCYIALEDIKKHYSQACDAGVEIVLELKEHHNGEYSYVARDIEGHLWNFGTYSPWEKLIKSNNKNEQSRLPFYQPRNYYAGPMTIFLMIALLLYSSFTFINSYLSTTKSPEDIIASALDTEEKKELSTTENNSNNSKNDFIPSLEKNLDLPSKEKGIKD
ncbi:MAG: VOC family protein, partial [Hyphomicrobium sp.]